MIAISARANTSLPEPGPPCTTNSIGRVGLNSAKAGSSSAGGKHGRRAGEKLASVHGVLQMTVSLAASSSPSWRAAHPPSVIALTRTRLSRPSSGDQQDQQRQAPASSPRSAAATRIDEVALRHHQRLAQRALHVVAEHEAEDQRRGRIFELAHQVAEQAEADHAGRDRTAVPRRRRRRPSRCRGSAETAR